MLRQFLLKCGISLATVGLLFATGVQSAHAGPGTLATEAAASPSGGTFYANSPSGVWSYTDAFGATRSSNSGAALHKFVDALPGLGTYNCVKGNLADPNSCHENDLGQYIPIARAVTPPVVWGIPGNSPPASDYYQIGIVDYTERMHQDLPAGGTHLRGYVDKNGKSTVGVPDAHYLGPLIIATKNKPVRIIMENQLHAGEFYLPLDTSYMGAGVGPPVLVSDGTTLCTQTQVDNALCTTFPFSPERTTVHLHGGHTPWISDGTPYQWFTPASYTGPYKRGASFRQVPDMFFNPTTHTPVLSTAASKIADPGQGFQTLYYTNQQSGRLLFYHDHALGTTRLNVYAGMAAGYLIVDPAVEDPLITAGTLPNQDGVGVYKYGIPLVIQDKTFVPQDIAVQDAKWSATTGLGYGNLWLPHVVETNQDPYATTQSGANDFGRWDYGPWFWPPQPVLADQALSPYPNVPVPEWALSGTPEAFMDTPVVNGTAYPYLDVNPKAYRFRILNAANDRPFNLQMYVADPTSVDNVASGRPTEVAMVSANERMACTSNVAATPAAPLNCTCTAVFSPLGCFPATWPTDGRAGGVPDPQFAGPKFIQIGSEAGFLPAPVVMDNQPVSFDYNRRNIVVLDILDKTLLLAPAERADVIVDFSAFAGKTIILYNDNPAPMPAFDSRYDYFTNAPDQLAFGGSAPTLPGFGPNTRTIMQFRVAAGTPQNTPPIYDPASPKLTTLNAAILTAFNNNKTEQPTIVPETANGGTTDVYGTIFDTSLTFTPANSSVPTTVGTYPKAIQELWDMYGRMNATLGVELPFTNNVIQTTIPLGYNDPITEVLDNGGVQIWKITHNGVDTHPVHFHLDDVQLINRVGWDGAIRPPDANEVGWKETIKMKPLEDILVALRPRAPVVPFTLPASVRLHDPTQAIGATLNRTSEVDGNPIAIINANENFGFEYVWHCHILGHEENDFMRPQKFNVRTTVPGIPTLSSAIADPSLQQVVLAWIPNATALENGFYVQRAATNSAGAFATIATVYNSAGYVDTTVAPSTTYFYRIVAFNSVGNSAASPTRSVATPAWVVTTITMTATPASSTAPATITMTATPVAGSGATISRVDFYVGTTRIATDTTSPYGYVWNTVPAGTYSISAKVTDSLGAVATSNTVSVAVYAVGPIASVNITSVTPPSPSAIGPTVTFSATALGGNGNPPQYQLWVRDPVTSTWTSSAYGTSPLTWNTTGLPAGTYNIQVWARNTGSAASYEAFTTTTYTLAAPLTSVSIASVSPLSPSIVGSTVGFSVTSVGGSGTPQYQLWVRNPVTGTWTSSAYSTSPLAWNTTGLPAGTYNIQVWARNTGSAASYEAFTTTTYTLLPIPVTAVSFTTITPPSPMGPGTRTPVTFTASATGGVTPQYQFWVLNPVTGIWSSIPYSTTPSWTWTTTGLPAGTYSVQVWSRSTGSIAKYDVFNSMKYVLN